MGTIRSVALDLRRKLDWKNMVRAAGAIPFPSPFVEGVQVAQRGAKQIKNYIASFKQNRPRLDLNELLQSVRWKDHVGLGPVDTEKLTAVVHRIESMTPAELNEQDIYGRAAIHFAAEYGLRGIVEALGDIPELDINACDIGGMTSIYLGVKGRQPYVVRTLLERGANPNVFTLDGGHALVTALENSTCDYIMARLLLHSGLCDVNINASKMGVTPLCHQVLRYNAKKMLDPSDSVALLVRYGADFNLRDGKGLSCLQLAIQLFGGTHPHVPAQIFLNTSPVSTPLSLDIMGEVYPTRKKSTQTPLMWMVGKKQRHAVRKLLQQGVENQNDRLPVPAEILPKTSTYYQPCTPFELSVLTGSAGCASLFIEEDLEMYASMLFAPAGYRFGIGFDDGWDIFSSRASHKTQYARPETLVLSGLKQANRADAVLWVDAFKRCNLDVNAKLSGGMV